ncbi:MAG: hypothetical protein B6I36_00350 [Desulfobacteraceae bacterium 4572_35.1]|nr:MAG: hypothetical protein B6I36_00350 [Desulfobacteraceae bacterium 4572_35.1]
MSSGKYHQPYSLPQQQYSSNRTKHFLENLFALVLIIITIFSLYYAAANMLNNDKSDTQVTKANTLIPAVYVHSLKGEKITL